MSGLVVLSLFDGLGGAAAALKKAGVEVAKYYAVELPAAKWARHISDMNHSPVRIVDDVRDFTAATAAKIGKVDLVVGGFPCQSFSPAGLQGGLDDPRGLLLFEAVRIIGLVKPKVWLLENVKMKREHRERVNEIIGVLPVEANSANYGAQHRKRLFWSNKKFEARQKPSPVVLADVLLPPDDARVAAQKVYEYTRFSAPFGRAVRIVGAIKRQSRPGAVRAAKDDPRGCQTHRVVESGGKMDALGVGAWHAASKAVVASEISINYRVTGGERSPTIMPRGKGGDAPLVPTCLSAPSAEKEPAAGGDQPRKFFKSGGGCRRHPTEDSAARASIPYRVYGADGKSGVMQGQSAGGNTDKLVEASISNRVLAKAHSSADPQAVPVRANDLHIRDKTRNAVALPEGKNPALKATASRRQGDNFVPVEGAHYARRLTVCEAARLQNLPDDYIPAGTPKNPAFAAIGNGFDIAVVADILRQILAPEARKNSAQAPKKII